MTLPLRDVAATLGAQLPAASVLVTGWSVDSRTLEAGDLFFALRGPKHDGHDYLADAFIKGAAAAVVDRPVETPGTLLRVSEALDALQSLAAWARLHWGGKVVAITGSAGKTTTKDVVAHLLEGAMPAGKSAGNLNNHVGVPLSILRLPGERRVAVLEMAMNHPGEIRRLAEIARPEIGVVTNVGHAHAGAFQSIDEIALAKRELIEALPPHGAAVLNADDPRVARFRDIHPGTVVTFGLSPEADVRAERVEYHDGGVRFLLDGAAFDSPLAGRHGLSNVLAGIAVAHVFGIEPERLRDAVRSLAVAAMRGRRFSHAGITVFDDCYNSNPEAARSMIDLLRTTPARRRGAVLGEMLELGHWSESLHRDVGSYVAQCGMEVLVGIRGAARFMVDQFLHSGTPGSAAYFFDDPAEAGHFARTLFGEGDAVLFKGSRATRVELALQQFLK